MRVCSVPKMPFTRPRRVSAVQRKATLTNGRFLEVHPHSEKLILLRHEPESTKGVAKT